MGRCLLCGKEVSNGTELCESCKKQMDSENNDAVKDVFVSDSNEVHHERAGIYNEISPSDGKWWNIFSVICGVLTACLIVVFMLVAFSESANVIVCSALSSASGICFILCFVFSFFAQVIKRKNMQIYLQNDILKELTQIRSKLK